MLNFINEDDPSSVRSKSALTSRIYSNQKKTSKRRGHVPPAYSRAELWEWLNSQELFHELYRRWESSGKCSNLVPSVDRLDDSIGYTLSNIQLLTWEENRAKGHKAAMEGKQGVPLKPVLQYSLDGELLCTFKSLREASDTTGTAKCNISQCCNNKRKTANNFIWSYK